MSIGRGGLVISSPSAPASSVLFFGSASIGTTLIPQILWPFFTLTPTDPLSVNKEYPLPFACILDRLYIKQFAFGNGNPVVYTVRKNGVSTALSVSISSAISGPVANLVDSVSFAQGDIINMQVTRALSLGPGTVEVVYASMRLTPL